MSSTSAGRVVTALVLLATAGSYGAGNDHVSGLMLFATGVAVLPAWLIWTAASAKPATHPQTPN